MGEFELSLVYAIIAGILEPACRLYPVLKPANEKINFGVKDVEMQCLNKQESQMESNICEVKNEQPKDVNENQFGEANSSQAPISDENEVKSQVPVTH